jgi:predicted amidohydrolase YtcJ
MSSWAACLAAGFLAGHQAIDDRHAADLILHNGRVWTVEASRPEARAVAVSGDRILAVGEDAAVLARRGPSTEVVDLKGRLVLPGFIDAHTHFENAADWLFRVGLFDCGDSRELARRLAAAARRIPKGMWITGGDLGAFAAWEAERAGRPAPATVVPVLAEIDAVTQEHPVLVRRQDHAYFANSLALRRARFGPATPDPRGGRIEKDPRTGAPTGMLFGRAGERVGELMPPSSLEQKVVGARAALEDLRRVGITSIHDVSRLDELSQRQTFPTHVERSSSDLAIFRELQRRGELSVRVYAFLTLSLWKEIAAAGIRPRTDEGLIRFGALKGFIDGFLMEAPYADDPRYAGDFTFRFVDEAAMARDVRGADASGFDPVVHTIGDKAHRLLLDWYEAAYRENPARDRRFRIIHAWYPSAREIERAGRLRLVADVTPFHLVRGLGSIEKRLGSERSRTAHAWRSLVRAGVRVNLVSDWPGSYNEQDPVPLSPLENIQLAVTRSDLLGRPTGGWHPEEKLTVPDAIEAYTINPAYASYEEERKGTIKEGKLADLVVLSKDILAIRPEEIGQTDIDLTVLGGKVIYRRELK